LLGCSLGRGLPELQPIIPGNPRACENCSTNSYTEQIASGPIMHVAPSSCVRLASIRATGVLRPRRLPGRARSSRACSQSIALKPFPSIPQQLGFLAAPDYQPDGWLICSQLVTSPFAICRNRSEAESTYRRLTRHVFARDRTQLRRMHDSVKALWNTPNTGGKRREF
jgi:hypothetical protein